jgi:alkylation response protein AidB-like acyl-CoA dehydrogenase
VKPRLASAAHERFRAEVREFVERELRPHADEWEKERASPREAITACGKRGYLSLDPWRNAVLAEELPRCESLGVALSVFVQSNLLAPMLEALGTPGQQQAWLGPLRAGELIGAMAVSEPGAGSDVAALESRATVAADGYLLSGIKTYITNGACADFLLVAARIHEDLSLLIVPSTTPGVRVEALDTLGLHTSAAGRLSFTDCRVPAGHVLGQAGAGLGYIQQALDRERLLGGIAAVAWAQYALDKTRTFARNRRAFGRPLAAFQAIRHQFAEMATTLEAARQLNYATFALWVEGARVTPQICMIKLFSYQAAQRVVEQCLHVHGGAGYLDDCWISRFYRDARALTIAAGTPEIMKEMIAAHLRL